MNWRTSTTLLSAAALAAPSCAPETTCTIVFDGQSTRTFQHEVAHCNGWVHPLDRPDPPTPRQFVHDYPGPMTLLICGRRNRVKAQSGAAVVFDSCSVSKRCIAMMTERGMNLSGLYNPGRIAGCSFLD